jgi:hypothetical protein
MSHLVDIVNNTNSNKNILKRSISNPERGSNDNLVLTDSQYLTNKNSNITSSHDPGYSSQKTMKINGIYVPYTEDRNINFSFDQYNVIGATDGHGGSPNMSILASGSFQIYFTRNIKNLASSDYVNYELNSYNDY